MKVPEWIKKADDNGPCACGETSTSHKRNFVSKTLIDIVATIERMIFSEKTAKEDGFMQKINPVAKLVFSAVFIILVSFIRNIALLAICYALIILFASLSRVRMGYFLSRSWLFIPLFSGIVAFPSLFNIVTPGDSALTIIRLSQPAHISGLQFATLSVTYQGIATFCLFIFRIGTMVSIINLLTSTTRWIDILKSFRIMGVPQIFVLVTGLTYKYIFLLLRVIQDMHLAKKSRTISTKKTSKRRETENAREWIASRIGVIFLKSKAISEETYLAMITRGFSGEIKTDERFRFRPIDYAFTGMAIAMLTGIAVLWWRL